MTNKKLDALVANGDITSYTYGECFDGAGGDAEHVILIFPSGAKIRIRSGSMEESYLGFPE